VETRTVNKKIRRKSSRDRFGDIGIDKKIKLKFISNKYGVDWIYLAQERAQ
jgi:hypothetical protein